MQIRVLLVDDHWMVLDGLASVLEGDPDFEVVGKASSAEEALLAIAVLRPDVAVIDVQLVGMDGIKCCAVIKERFPKLRVVVMTGSAEVSTALAAFEGGADGFTMKESDCAMFRDAVRTVVLGETYIDPRTTSKLVALAVKAPVPKNPRGLTDQEVRVLELLPKGWTNAQIAEHLCLSIHTIKSHLRNAMRKLGAGDRNEAAAIVLQEGLAGGLSVE